jgi:GNAT superfamily N-acetyltransferase
MTVTVRPCASLLDVAALEATVPTGASEFHRQRFEREDGSVYLAAWLGDRAVGSVLVTPESKYAEVRRRLGRFPEANALGVAGANRRTGVGRALVAAAAGAALEWGSDRLGLAVEPDNAPAIALYRALGFERRDLVVVDEWAWRDVHGDEHQECDRCTYWTLGIDATTMTP